MLIGMVTQMVLFPRGGEKREEMVRPHFSPLSKFSIPIPPLLQLCRDIRAEASVLYYGRFVVTANALPHLLPWLRSLDKEARAALGMVKLFFDPWDKVDKTKEQQIVMCLKKFKEAGVELERRRFDLVVQKEDIPRSEGTGDMSDDDEVEG
jgi:hypothetical protein